MYSTLSILMSALSMSWLTLSITKSSIRVRLGKQVFEDHKLKLRYKKGRFKAQGGDATT